MDGWIDGNQILKKQALILKVAGTYLAHKRDIYYTWNDFISVYMKPFGKVQSKTRRNSMSFSLVSHIQTDGQIMSKEMPDIEYATVWSTVERK